MPTSSSFQCATPAPAPKATSSSQHNRRQVARTKLTDATQISGVESSRSVAEAQQSRGKDTREVRGPAEGLRRRWRWQPQLRPSRSSTWTGLEQPPRKAVPTISKSPYASGLAKTRFRSSRPVQQSGRICQGRRQSHRPRMAKRLAPKSREPMPRSRHISDHSARQCRRRRSDVRLKRAHCISGNKNLAAVCYGGVDLYVEIPNLCVQVRPGPGIPDDSLPIVC